MRAMCCTRTASWVALDAQGDNALREILLAASSSDAALGEKRISVRLTARDGAEYITHVLPLTSGARRRAGQSYAAVAAIFVQKVGHDAAPGLDMLVEQFGLTGAEVRVLTAIMDHGGVAEVATALKLSLRDGAHPPAPCVRKRPACGAPGGSLRQADDQLSDAGGFPAGRPHPAAAHGVVASISISDGRNPAPP